MIGTKPIEEILELAIYSGYVKDEQPVSVLVAASVEAGKTEIMMKYPKNKGCLALTDATAFGIMRDYKDKITSREVRHIMIPDLIKPMSRGKDTVHTLVAFFNALLEEGVFRISTYAETIGVKEEITPVKCGLIATMAKGYLHDGRHHWSQMGFMSRMLPVSFDYSPGTQRKIHDSIANRDYLSDAPISLTLPDDDVKVTLENPEGEKLMILAAMIASAAMAGGAASGTSPEKIYGFRLQKHIQRLAMANALKDNRDNVTITDVEKIEELSGFINLNYQPI